MRFPILAVLAAVTALSAASAQIPKKKSALTRIASKIVDTTLTSAASGMVDSVLGTGGAASGAGCPAGTVPTAATAGVAGVAPASQNTAGTAIVGAAKRKILKAKADSSAPATSIVCVPAANPTQQAAALQAAQAQAAQAQAMQAGAGAAPGMNAMTKGLMMATPAGAIVAAAPMAGKAAKALGGLLGKGPSTEGMIKDLGKGRLVLKGVRFIEGSDALMPGFEDDLTMLAEALTAMEGQFVLNLPAEAADKAEPDTVMARRRLTKLVAHLLVAGIPRDRLIVGIYPPELDAKKKAPKPGDAIPEVLRAPKDFKP